MTSSHTSSCSYKDADFDETFNYYALSLQPNEQLNYYTVDDDTQENDETTYKYYFNLCNKVLSYDGIKQCNGTHTYCTVIDSSTEPHTCSGNILNVTGLTYGYQVSNKEDEDVCFSLSNTQNPEKSLIDPGDPSQGFKLDYSNGDWDAICGRNREFIIYLHCENDASTIPRSTNVIEEALCKYRLDLYTSHGCPSGCTSYANQLCGSNGLCGYDFSLNTSHCFCYWGLAGSSCEKDTTSVEWMTLALDFPVPKPLPPYEERSERFHEFLENYTTTDPMTGVERSSHVKVQYDLRDAYSTEEVYIVDDSNSDSQYKYYFNIAGNIDLSLIPEECHHVAAHCDTLDDISSCDQTAILSASYSERPGLAFRYFNGSKTAENNSCVLLGQDIIWDLYDHEDNAAHGVSLNYTNGSYSIGCRKNYQIQINLICPDTRVEYEEYFIPADETLEWAEDVEELDDCSYRLNLETAFACPWNCITEIAQDKNRHDKLIGNEFAVCGGHGLCVADPFIGFVRCLCDDTWFGDDCLLELNEHLPSGSTTTDSHTGYHVAIAIITILLVAFIIGVVYLFMRNKVLEKYALPMLDDQDRDHQIEPRVPDLSDSDEDERLPSRPKIGGQSSKGKEMVNITNDKKNKKNKKKKQKKTHKKFGIKKTGYSAQLNDDYSDSDDDDSDDENRGMKLNQNNKKNKKKNDDDDDDDNDEDDEDNNGGPSAKHYLAAGQGDSDESDE